MYLKRSKINIDVSCTPPEVSAEAREEGIQINILTEAKYANCLCWHFAMTILANPKYAHLLMEYATL